MIRKMRKSPARSPADREPPPFWSKEKDWLVIVLFLPRGLDQREERASTAEAIGYMLAYSQITDTRMLALLDDPNADAYELLFSFSGPENKAEFLRLLRSNEFTDCEDEEILVPIQDEIDAARPLMEILPSSVFEQVALTAASLVSGLI
jgi:hypothetical protein